MGNVIMNIPKREFGLLCICALRYCQGRMTFVPDKVLEIVRKYLRDYDDQDIKTMLNDCEVQRATQRYGCISIDKPKWLQWEAELKAERERRGI